MNPTLTRDSVAAVSADKTTPDGAPDPLEDAMAEAVASMEAREKGDEVTLEPKKDSNTAITEALIAAKKELQEALEQTKKETESFRDKWLRAAADLENYKKRAVREREELEKFANERLLKDLLPILDDLDRALAGVAATTDAKLVVDGLRLLQKKFLTQLEKHHVTTFESSGKGFDPSLHEAVQQVHADTPAGTVAAELQRGFMISGRLLRPALVTVSLGPAAGQGEKT